jgi:predicted transposase YdaD
MTTLSDDYDSPWKDAVTRYFPEFMAFYFPAAHGEIDWQQPYVFLEQELAQVVRDAELGRRRVDKLVRVVKRGGVDEWVFVHIDVQGRFDKKFAERVFVYNYRIYDRYRRPVASLAVLADAGARWKPVSFHYKLFGCEVGIRYPVVKLNDYAGSVDELLTQPNVFALVTAAHLLTQQTRGQLVKRFAAKGRLARLLFERQWERQRIVDLFNVIDWMMWLPASLQTQLMCDIEELERKHQMPYISSFERRGLERGIQKGRQEGKSAVLAKLLEKRFGPLPPAVAARIVNATPTQLEAWLETILDAPTLDSVFVTR